MGDIISQRKQQELQREANKKHTKYKKNDDNDDAGANDDDKDGGGNTDNTRSGSNFGQDGTPKENINGIPDDHSAK